MQNNLHYNHQTPAKLIKIKPAPRSCVAGINNPSPEPPSHGPRSLLPLLPPQDLLCVVGLVSKKHFKFGVALLLLSTPSSIKCRRSLDGASRGINQSGSLTSDSIRRREEVLGQLLDLPHLLGVELEFRTKTHCDQRGEQDLMSRIQGAASQ